MDHQVIIGCRSGSVLVECAREAGCDAHDRFQFRGGVRLAAWWHDVSEAKRLIRRWQPDVIHVSGSQDHWTFGLASRMMGRPARLVRTRHNTYPVSDNMANRLLNLHWTDYQIVVCHSVRETLAKQSAFDAARMCTVHNGVDATLFRPDPDARQKARAEFGYSDDDFVCGIAARLVEAKGHEFLLKAVASLRPEHHNLRLLVLGQGNKEKELRQLAQDLHITDIVTFAGFRRDMAYCVQAFDVGVQPSIDCDTSSFSLKEQMAAQIPVIASDYGGLTEIVTNGVEGLIVPAGTVEPLALAIRTLAQDTELCEKMGKAGRQRVEREFTVEVFAERTLEAYRRAIEIAHERFAH